jgi:hypothetical protein
MMRARAAALAPLIFEPADWRRSADDSGLDVELIVR